MSKKHTNGFAFDQASALPYRFRRGQLEFCLITSTGKRRWSFPKGVIDPGETPAETALKEAAEEAGLAGEICGKPLGKYQYSKWGQSLKVLVMLMKVKQTASRWDEGGLRDRQWVKPQEAVQLIDRPRLRRLVQLAIKRLETGAA
ncbi:MAG: NUDIX hydrolase [Pirellulaceae bacterium]|nr:NUDIX hydrolase [Pirellulaceae bacterium]